MIRNTKTKEVQPSHTLDENNILKQIDGIEALKQSIERMLTTERYQYSIYDHRYGIEFSELIGGDADFARLDIERRVKECLFEDDRIENIYNFYAQIIDDNMLIRFDVDTIIGTINMEVNL
ncbi:Protein of unknown function [Granulicatella balaenopterae]|uniref:DUF2634 domain-containing protein n=1 Tax=Granulicatella balaenopterae TaxID=137733 RepID=A0A1H9IKV9_9LACT|nr:DUF2634 domain-containing protein [Granulicatella balaenopterae]SEQ75015.1 Protein of unknown function [Granulicatella balaenopterae]